MNFHGISQKKTKIAQYDQCELMNTKKLDDRKRLEPERPHSSSGNLTSLRDLASHGNLTSQGSRRLPVAAHPVGFRTGFELDAHISGKHHEVNPTRLQHTPGDLSTAAAAPAAAVDAVAIGARIPG